MYLFAPGLLLFGRVNCKEARSKQASLIRTNETVLDMKEDTVNPLRELYLLLSVINVRKPVRSVRRAK